MDIRIGMLNTARELSFETDTSAAEVEQAVAAALAGESQLLRLVDAKGAVVLIPAAALAYVELGAESPRRVGFVA